MSFNTDKPTHDDLNLLGQHRPGSVYGLFHQVKTRGGERLLDQLFRNPLTDPKAINQRTAIFGYLQERNYSFPFDRQQCHLVEDYLGGLSTGNFLFTTVNILRKKWMGSLLKDEEFGLIVEGVRATLAFLHTCRNFIRQFDETSARNTPPTSPLQDHLHIITTILADQRLVNLPPVPASSWQKTARCHHLFRKVLQ